MFRVVSVDEHGHVRAACLWGNQKGDELIFENAADVLELFNKKRG